MGKRTKEKRAEERAGVTDSKAAEKRFRRAIVNGVVMTRKGVWKKWTAEVLLVVLASVAMFFFGRYLSSDDLEVTFYHHYSSKITGTANTRLVVLSDLHNREFGSGNRNLIRQIADLKPDLIIMAGDMVNAWEDDLDVILNLCKELLKIAPIYYGPGNHENHLFYEKGSDLESLLTEMGVHVLVNRAEEVTIHKTPFLIGGLTTDVDGYEEYGAGFIEEYEKSRDFKLLIAHYPSLYYEALADTKIDLGICGHFHGGLVRFPFVGGLYHGDTGPFPKYSGGMYRLPQSTIFVSRGMEDHSGFPRINNRPELAVIDINGRQETDNFTMERSMIIK